MSGQINDSFVLVAVISIILG